MITKVSIYALLHVSTCVEILKKGNKKKKGVREGGKERKYLFSEVHLKKKKMFFKVKRKRVFDRSQKKRN